MNIYWLQLINWIVAGAITAIFVLIGYFIQKKYEQRKKEAEKKRAEEGERRNRIRSLHAGEEHLLGDLKEALAGIPMSSYQKPASTGRISRIGIVGFFVITTFIMVYLFLLVLEQYYFMVKF